MRQLLKPRVSSQALDPSDSLVPPAVKGLTVGFIGGLIAVLALSLLVPSSPATATAAKAGTVSVR